MKVALTDVYLRSVAVPKSGRLEIADARCAGLTLRVTPNDVRSWSFRYRDKKTGRVERLSLGRYPDISLAQARALGHKNRGLLVSGANPQKELRRQRIEERGAISFDELADRFLADYVSRETPKSLPSTTSYLQAVRAAWRGRKAKDIDRLDVIALLRDRAKVAPISANRTKSVLSKLFFWAIDEAILEQTPVVRIARPAAENPRDRVLSDTELALLWRAFGQLEAPAMVLAFRFLALVGQRPGEVVGMRLSELNGLGRGETLWEIPGERTKNGRRHVVPLTPLAASLVEEAVAMRQADADSPFVFVSSRVDGEPFDRHSFARAEKRLIGSILDFAPRDPAADSLVAQPPTPHDFRRTFVTGLGRLGVAREVIKATVNHAEGDITEIHYDRYDRLPEKRKAFAAWEGHIRGLIGDPLPHNVVAISGAA